MNILLNNKLRTGVRSNVLLFFVTLIVATSIANGQAVKGPEANPDIDQCANGKRGNPLEPCTGNNWQNGNINENNAQYVEGESVPFRIIYTGLTPNTQYSVLIEWDTTKSGKSAYDYLTTYDRSYPVGNDPCDGVTGCALGSYAAAPIPIDPDVTGGFDRNIGTPGDNIVQVPGEFRVFGMSSCLPWTPADYGFSGSYAGDSTRTLLLTCTTGPANAGANTNVVVAWGGHIARRADWGLLNSAISIEGSPYHMRTGGQDRSLKIAAVLFPGSVTILKQVFPWYGTGASTTPFPFVSSANFGVSNFFLVDNNVTGPDRRTNSNIQLFGAANAITVTEGSVSGGWQILDLSCVEIDGGNGLSVNDSVPQGPSLSNTATIIVQEGEIVVCTYQNGLQQPTAAPASINGRIVNRIGRGIAGVQVTLVDVATGTPRSATTNAFGYYRFDNVETTLLYSLSVSSKRYTFEDPTRVFTLNEDLFDMNFISSN